MEVLERLPKELQSDVFKILDEVTDVASLSKSERAEYDYALKRYRDSIGMIRGAKMEGREEGREEGLREGLLKGERKGRQEGLREGERKGRQDGLREGRIETARNMKVLGISWETIQAASGLSLDEIAKL